MTRGFRTDSDNEIPDLLRMMTISDVFGALVEWRSDKPRVSSEAVYQVLLDANAKRAGGDVVCSRFPASAVRENE